ncbi:hypothetical protein NP233_g12122 [Leucocoprinus birnbaumii]|uniref:phytol kinase n=1 Tax=Leucocoprinus birnbaumii TaxID=56174 RepID=A0AAD5VEZ9_9AGAR|nr:hypothetical protein NP233_g12122 [Leucocoprinus birnbaumii]
MVEFHTYPVNSVATAASAISVMKAVSPNNEALGLKQQGDYPGSEKLYLEALEMKLAALGENNATTALTRNALGELYLPMGRLDAEDQLKAAVRVYEAKGDLEKALETRVSYNTDTMVCSNYNCPASTFRKSDLKTCSRCKAVFYCGNRCQNVNWSARHKKFCKAPPSKL